MFRKILLTIALAGLVGCSFGKNTNDETHREVELQDQQKAVNSKVVGTYSGQINAYGQLQDIELEIFQLSEKNGKNSDGTDRMIYTLHAIYKRLHPAGLSVTLNVRYYPETGEMTLTRASSNDSSSGSSSSNSGTDTIGDGAKSGHDEIHTITAVFAASHIKGTAVSEAGPIGSFDLALSTKESAGSGKTDQDRYDDDLRRVYEAVAGTYTGIIVPSPQERAPYKVTLRLYVVDVSPPQLIGTFTPNTKDGDAFALNLTTDYRPDLTPAELTMVGTLQNAPVGTTYKAVIKGKFIDGEYRGSMTSTVRPFEGSFILKKATEQSQHFR
jgi:hypothetical protein